MSKLIDKARLEPKLGKYATGPANALTDPTLLPRVQAYRRTMGARMQALDKDGMQRKLPEAPYHLSRKIDGEFSVLVYDGKIAFLVNPGGTVRAGLELLNEATAALKKAKIKSAIVAGELHSARPDGKRARVHDVSRIARRPEDQEALDTLRFSVFDFLDIDGEAVTGDYADTWQTITTTFTNGSKVNPVETVLIEKSRSVSEYFENWVEGEDAEGLVARSDSAGIFKIKPRHTIDVAVVGFAESIDDREGMLHDLLIAVVRPDGSFHIAGHVGGGFSDDERKEFLADLQDLVVESEYAEVNKDRVAYRMVKPEWVIEISCLDLVSQNTRGASIDRMVINWNGESWDTVRRLPLASIISPQFVRRRDDKSANKDDVRIAQLTDIVEIGDTDKTAGDLVLPKSELLRREVVTKVLKEKTMVRKLLMWKTNKEEHDENFPAFVLHLTDFSPNRKDPMKREIRVSSDQKQINDLWDELREKFFVGGWNPPEKDD